MVVQKDLDGNEIRTYKSLREAHRLTGVNRSTIAKYLRGERSNAGGYLWETTTDFNSNENKNMHTTYDDVLAEEGYTREEVSSVKIWQTMRGETRYSIVVKTDEEEVNTLKEDILKDIKKFKPEYPKYKYKKQTDPIAVMIGIPDAHISKLVEGNDEWTIDTAVKVFMKTIEDLHQRVATLNVERFILPIGNDGLNSEGKRRTTTKGTAQVDSCGWRKAFRMYWQMIVKAVDYLTPHAPVDILVIPGNHDWEVMFYTGDVLSAWYKDHKNVTVNNDDSPRKYYQYGNMGALFTHGDKEKMAELPLIFADEEPEIWLKTKHKEVYTGHLHKEVVNEYRGVKVRHLPSICPTDSWVKQNGWRHTRAAQAHIWNKEKGYEGYLQINV